MSWMVIVPRHAALIEAQKGPFVREASPIMVGRVASVTDRLAYCFKTWLGEVGAAPCHQNPHPIAHQYQAVALGSPDVCP